MFSTKVLSIAVGVVTLVAISSFLTNGYVGRHAETDRQHLAVALSQLHASEAHAAVAEKQATINAARGDSAERQVALFEFASKRAVASSRDAWAKFDSLAAQDVCDSTCITVARAAHLQDSVALSASQAALAAEKVASARYKLGLDQAVTALAELTGSAKSVEVAAKPLVKPRFHLSQLLPKIGVAAAAGLDVHGKPNVVTGIALTYNF